MNIQIREFITQDTVRIKELIATYNQFFEDIDPWKAIAYGDNAVEFYFKQMVDQTNIGGKFFVVIVHETIVGFIQGHVHLPSTTEIMERGNFKSGDIENVFILEPYRSLGIGKLLMQEMENFFVSQGCSSIALNVFAPNVNAQEFYKKLGFTTRAMIMVKRLPTQ